MEFDEDEKNEIFSIFSVFGIDFDDHLCIRINTYKYTSEFHKHLLYRYLYSLIELNLNNL